jgi:hypothetical protein
MSVPEFMNRLRLVAGLIPPALFAPEMSLGVFPTPTEDRQWRKALASADVWLDVSFVAGVVPADFEFLDDTGRVRLGNALASFARAAGDNPAAQQLATEQRELGLTALVDLIQVLPILDVPGKFLVQKLWELEPNYPDYIFGFECEFGTDSTSDPAVWIHSVVPDETDVQTPEFDRFMDDVKRTTRVWLESVRLPHWPYVRLFTPSDIKDQIAGVVE